MLLLLPNPCKMKAKIAQLIDRLADKSLTFGQKIVMSDTMQGTFIGSSAAANWMIYNNPSMKVWSKKPDKKAEILGHPILIGNILSLASIAWEKEQQDKQWLKICQLWFECDTTKSLQAIYAQCDFILDLDKNSQYKEVPKQQSNRELFQFLLSLGL